MVTIKNKEMKCSLFVGIDRKGKPMTEDVETSIFTQIKMVMASPKQAIKTEDMRKAFRVLDAVELAEKNNEAEIKLEDADYENLKKEVLDFQYQVPNKNAIEFEDYIVGVKKK